MRVKSKLRSFANKQNALGKILSGFYLALLSPYVQALINIGFTIWAGILFADEKLKGMACFIISYSVTTLGLLWINHHAKKKNRDTNCFQKALQSQTVINATMANELHKLNKRIQSKISFNTKIGDYDLKDLYGFQKVAFTVCEEIYSLVKEIYEYDQQHITVFRQFEENGIKFSRMVAYRTHLCKISDSYNENYPLFQTKEQKNNYYHSSIFESKSAEIRVLINQEEVMENFKLHDNCIIREKKICQYIGVPVKVNTGEIAFILQVDIDEKNAFGKDKYEVIEFANNVLLPYAQLLSCVLEQEHILDTMNKNLKVNSLGKKGRSAI